MKLSRRVCALESDWRSDVRNEAPPQHRCRAIFGIRVTSVGRVSTPNPGFVRPPEGVQSFWGVPANDLRDAQALTPPARISSTIKVSYSHSWDHGFRRQNNEQAPRPRIAPRDSQAPEARGGIRRSVVEMIESGRPCIDVAQQLHAVEKAVGQAKKALIQDHLDHCLEEVVGPLPRDQRASKDELRQITKYL